MYPCTIAGVRRTYLVVHSNCSPPVLDRYLVGTTTSTTVHTAPPYVGCGFKRANGAGLSAIGVEKTPIGLSVFLFQGMPQEGYSDKCQGANRIQVPWVSKSPASRKPAAHHDEEQGHSLPPGRQALCAILHFNSHVRLSTRYSTYILHT